MKREQHSLIAHYDLKKKSRGQEPLTKERVGGRAREFEMGKHFFLYTE